MKKIEDYLNLYIGAMCCFDDVTMSESEQRHDWNPNLTINYFILQQYQKGYLADFKFALRPLSDMTESEAREFLLDVMHFANAFGIYPFNYKIEKGFLSFQGMGGNYSVVIKNWGKEGDGEWLFNCTYSINDVVWLLKRGFDIFGLISENIALDKTKIKNEVN